MANNASDNFVSSFDAMVKHAFQGQMKLRNAVRVKTGVVGSSHRFHVLGAGQAQVRIPQTDVVPMNIDHSNATATLTDYVAPEYSDVYDINKLSFDEKSELVFTVASAIGRRLDQLIIDAMNASSPAKTVLYSVPSTASSGLVLEKILRAKRLLDDDEVPEDDRMAVISSRSLETALNETEIGSSDFNVVKSLMDGSLKKYAGFQFIMIGSSRPEGALPIPTTTSRNNYFFHKSAVGLAIGLDMKTEINYIPEKTSYLVNGLFSAGSAVIDGTGLVEVQTEEV